MAVARPPLVEGKTLLQWQTKPLLHLLPFPSSAGVGRTGCFIVIDAMLERIKHEKTVDIYGHVTLMRSQRNYMVQTEDQYSFIHDALLEAVACGNTEVPARNLYTYIQKLAQIEAREHVTGMELEFKVDAWMGTAGPEKGSMFFTGALFCWHP